MDLNATLLFECLFFLSFVGLTRMFVWPPIEAVLDQRRTEIQISLEKARVAEEELERAQNEAKELISQARAKCDEKIKQAIEEAGLLTIKAREGAEKIAFDLTAAAAKDIERQKIAVRDQLKKEVVKTAILMLNKVLKQQTAATEKVLMTALIQDVDDAS